MRKILLRLFLSVIALIYVIPLLIIFTNSFMPPEEITRNYGDEFDAFDNKQSEEISYVEYSLIPSKVTIGQYFDILLWTPMYLDLFINSLKLTLPIVLIQVVVGSAAAYGFTVWKSRFREILFGCYIILMVLPFQASLVPNYIMADTLKILNTHSSIILPWAFNPFAVFIMRQSMKSIPVSIYDAAQIDGAGHLRRFLQIAIPISKAGIASLIILSFTDCWAMTEQPLIFLMDAAMEPLSVMLYTIGQENMGLIFAASVFYMLPVIWIFLYGQEYFEQGIKLSSFK